MTHSSSSSSSSSSSILPLASPSSLVVIKDPRYQRGKVYEIVVLHEDYKDDLYVGSTICPRLSTRLGQHKIEAEQDEPTKKLHVLMKTLGVRFFKIVLIEDWPCDSKQELCKREQYHMTLRKPTLNMVNAYLTKEERLAYQKDYREDNKAVISARDKDYREENKEAHKAYMKEYYEENKDAHKKQAKIHYEENKEAYASRGKIYREENAEAISARRKIVYEANRLKINAQRRDRWAKAKLSYKDKVVIAVKEALALRFKKREAGRP